MQQRKTAIVQMTEPKVDKLKLLDKQMTAAN